MSEIANPEPSRGSEAANAIGDEPPASERKTRRKLRLRDMQSAAQSGGWMWMEKDAIDRLLLNTGIVEAGLVFSTYAALCRLSSDRGNATSVTVGMTLISKQAGLFSAHGRPCAQGTVARETHRACVACAAEIATTRTPIFCSRAGRVAAPGV